MSTPSTQGTLVAGTLARKFHEAYERLAPGYGYRTREESAVPWERLPEKNRLLMIGVAVEIIDLYLQPLLAAERAAQSDATVRRFCEIYNQALSDGCDSNGAYDTARDADYSPDASATEREERLKAETRIEEHDEICKDCGIENGVLAECPRRTKLRLDLEYFRDELAKRGDK